MARIPQITRTITTTKAVVLCAHTDTETVEKVEVILPRTYKDEKNLIKSAKNAIETDTVKVISVVSTTTEETLYGMSEQDFINHAEILPPRKNYNEDNAQ